MGGTEEGRDCFPRGLTIFIFMFAAVVAGVTVAGPGLSWDEPAYRGSQLLLQDWGRELASASTWKERQRLFEPDAIGVYWEFNRFGPNFHPPMASYLNLSTYALVGRVWDDISSRRLASALEFAAVVAMIGTFVGRKLGRIVGIFSALSLLFMPRLMGEAHVIGTDMPILFFWVAAALAAWRSLDVEVQTPLRRRMWQWWTGMLVGCLFLVKFSGVMIAIPFIVWFIANVLLRQPAATVLRWCWRSVGIVGPIFVFAVIELMWSKLNIHAVSMARHVDWLLVIPPIALAIEYWRRPGNTAGWDVRLELPWVVLTAAPLTAIALNPTWWNDPAAGLAEYLELNLGRRDRLPDIAIYYLGAKHVYSLPWHNAFVLMAVTIPFGVLVTGIVGVVRSLAPRNWNDWPMYFLVHALTLPVVRMLPTPAHDGVRLFLPTFAFWAGLAGLGAHWMVSSFNASPPARRSVWAGLYLLCPIWSAVEWTRIHPYEFSFYNVGLARAMDWGFEPTYWYDAVTPRTLAEVNERIPPRASVIVHVDPSINPETFFALQSLGRLRSDINLDPAKADGFPWVWLLTHSAKSTPFTRLLFACPPFYASGPGWSTARPGTSGVRLFSVVDDRSVALAWAIHLLVVIRDGTTKDPRIELNETALAASENELRTAVELVRKQGIESRDDWKAQTPAVRNILEGWKQSGSFTGSWQQLQRNDPSALARAIPIIAARREDIRTILTSAGYLRAERFGGYLKEKSASELQSHRRPRVWFFNPFANNPKPL